ncbi:hypothetical protein [Pyruvatibacter sp.]|uniref:hypothetical protein n=1 Tax=Pyruvatibacter sp. TaxID=1981328 RepID=UPI0032630398
MSDASTKRLKRHFKHVFIGFALLTAACAISYGRVHMATSWNSIANLQTQPAFTVEPVSFRQNPTRDRWLAEVVLKWMAQDEHVVPVEEAGKRADIQVYLSNGHRRPSYLGNEWEKDGLQKVGRFYLSGGAARVFETADGTRHTFCNIKYNVYLFQQELAADFLRRHGWSDLDLTEKISLPLLNSSISGRSPTFPLMKAAAALDPNRQDFWLNYWRSDLYGEIFEARRIRSLSSCATLHAHLAYSGLEQLAAYRARNHGAGPFIGVTNIIYSYFTGHSVEEERLIRQTELDRLLETPHAQRD